MIHPGPRYIAACVMFSWAVFVQEGARLTSELEQIDLFIGGEDGYHCARKSLFRRGVDRRGKSSIRSGRSVGGTIGRLSLWLRAFGERVEV